MLGKQLGCVGLQRNAISTPIGTEPRKGCSSHGGWVRFFNCHRRAQTQKDTILISINRRLLLLGAATAALPLRRARASTPIRIGVLTDMTGVYADDSGQGSVVAAKLAIEDFRQMHGDIAVELISADFQNKPDIAANTASAWFDRDGVDLVIDVPVSSAALAVANVAKQRNKAAIFNAGTSALTGPACSPNHAHWSFDTYALANSTSRAIVAEGGDAWFFIQANYAFGASLTADASAIIKSSGGRVLGVVKYPFPETANFASFLLQAQSSGAKVIGLASAGADTANLVKQAGEFGLRRDGKTKIAALLCFIPQIHALGLKDGEGFLDIRSLLLVIQRPNSRADGALRPERWRRQALYHSDGLLFWCSSLSESRSRSRRRCRQGKRRRDGSQDEGNTDRRHRLWEGAPARRRSQDSRHALVPGQGSGSIDPAVGLLPSRSHNSWRRGFSAACRRQLPADPHLNAFKHARRRSVRIYKTVRNPLNRDTLSLKRGIIFAPAEAELT